MGNSCWCIAGSFWCSSVQGEGIDGADKQAAELEQPDQQLPRLPARREETGGGSAPPDTVQPTGEQAQLSPERRAAAEPRLGRPLAQGRRPDEPQLHPGAQSLSPIRHQQIARYIHLSVDCSWVTCVVTKMYRIYNVLFSCLCTSASGLATG